MSTQNAYTNPLFMVFLILGLFTCSSISEKAVRSEDLTSLQDPFHLMTWVHQKQQDAQLLESHKTEIINIWKVWTLIQAEMVTNPSIFEQFVNQLKIKRGIPFNPNVSADCGAGFANMIQGLLSQKTVVLELLDSWGKPGAGVLWGNFKWHGSLEQCQSLNITDEIDDSRPAKFYSGRYCLAQIQQRNSAFLSPQIGQMLQFLVSQLRLGICAPEVCNAFEVGELLAYGWIELAKLAGRLPLPLPGINITAVLLSVTPTIQECKTKVKDEKLNTNGIIALAGAGLLVVLALIASIIDYIVTWMNKEIKSKMYQVVLSFSIKHNLGKIFAPPSEDSIGCLNGIRSFSIFWVILGHTLLFAWDYLDNGKFIQDIYTKRISALLILNATVSVDTFFVLSGCLVAYHFFKVAKSNPKIVESPLFWVQYYVHRYWRLTPVLIIFIALYMPLLRYIGEGIFFPGNRDNVVDSQNCAKYWWTNILYINNFYPSNQSDMCIGHSWYLANDFQFFIVSPLMLLPFFWGGIGLGSIVVLAFVLLSVTSTAVLNNNYGFNRGFYQTLPGHFGPEYNHFSLIYIKPYCRVGPYAIGILLGYVLSTHKKLKINMFLALILWIAAAVLALGMLFAVHNNVAGYGPPMSLEVSSAYWGIMRSAWAVSIFWVIFACSYGYGGPINDILSWSWFAPIARLTYSMYLCHIVVNNMFLATMDMKLHYTDSTFIYLFFGNLLSAGIGGLILSTLVEAPLLGLEKLIFPRPKPKPVTKKLPKGHPFDVDGKRNTYIDDYVPSNDRQGHASTLKKNDNQKNLESAYAEVHAEQPSINHVNNAYDYDEDEEEPSTFL